MPTPIGIYSASGISAILGLNPYTTRLHAWQNVMEKLQPGFNAKKGYTLPEFPDNPPIRWGHGFEQAIIKLAEEKRVQELSKSSSIPETRIFNQEKVFIKSFPTFDLSCHIDGQYSDSSDGFMVLHEGKTTWSRAFYSVKGEDCEVELELDHETGIHVPITEIEYKRRWGDPGTDCVPAEYQIQAAVQRICTEAELVRLAVLVFPKNTQEFEDLGWRITERKEGGFLVIENRTELERKDIAEEPRLIEIKEGVHWVNTMFWAKCFSDIGNFHTYNLPTNKKLESLIIEKIQEFDEKYVKTELPPEFEDYADVRRLVTQPMGTIIATPEMIVLAAEYSEINRQIGDSGPMKKRQATIKVEIMNFMTTARRDDWAVPSDKLILVDHDGGEKLISFSKSGFRCKRA